MILSEYRSSRELFANLTLRELRSKYKRSVLGWAWSLFNPLATVVVYTILFKYFLKIRVLPGTPSGLNVWSLYLMTALLPWNYFQTAVFNSIGSLTANSALIKKTYFPRGLLPAAAVGAAVVSHLIEMGLLLVALLAFSDWRAIVFLPIAVLLSMIMTAFALGFGLAVSALNVFFRDIEHFMGILFLVWLYMTPIVYPIYDVPPHIQTILKLNPMTDMANSYRAVLYNGTLPSWLELAYFAVWAGAMLVAGMFVFGRFQREFAEEL